VSFSDDGGHIWATINQTFAGMDEAVLTQLANGSVLLNMRHTSSPKTGRAIAISHDDGLTFGAIQYDATLISPVCQASLVSFDGQSYFSNPATHWGRSHISIRRSSDSCVTWSSTLLITPAATFGYSCLVQGALVRASQGNPGGLGGILYEAAGETIKFAQFPLHF